MAKNEKGEQSQTEQTISAYISDTRRNVKKITKGIESLSDLGKGTEIEAAKNALTAKREAVAKEAAQRVYQYLLKSE